jgi:hypothetical protein
MSQTSKHCNYCKVEHPLTKEYWQRLEGSPKCKVRLSAANKKRHELNREKILAYGKKWREENKEKHKEANRRWREENAEKHKQNARDWYWNNKDYAIARSSKYQKERKKTDVQFRLACNLRTRLANAMRGGPKSTSAIRHLGCSLKEFRAHMEAQFKDGMSWDNYGTVWEVDHVRPLANYDLTNPEIAKQLCHYTNLQPLFSLENKQKSNKE